MRTSTLAIGPMLPGLLANAVAIQGIAWWLLFECSTVFIVVPLCTSRGAEHGRRIETAGIERRAICPFRM